MPRDRELASQGDSFFQPPTAMMASARRMDIRKTKGKKAKIDVEPWQRTCWYFYDVIGEYYYAMNWVGNHLSRAKLIVTKNGKPVKTGAAVDYVDSLFGGKKEQAEMLRQLGVHLSVAGEAYVVGESQGTDRDSWQVVSAMRIREVQDGFTIGGDPLKAALVLKIFRPHPVDPRLATSSSRPVLPILAELEGFTKRVAADIDSRLTGAGLLLFPSEVDFPSAPTQMADGEMGMTRAGVDGIQDMLQEAASIAITDQSSASAKVPIAMQMRGDQIANVRHITFWSEFDAAMKELRQEAIGRLALGLDMPPEALTGTGDMNHWNAWQLEEAAIKVHMEPVLSLITTAFTTDYLWKLLADDGMGEDEYRQYAIEADTTELRLRPNRSKEAQELYGLGKLSGNALLRENGFDPDADAMKGEEYKLWLIQKVASGSTTPELVAEALRLLQVPIEAAEAPEAEPTEAPLPPSLREHPTRDIPEQPEGNPPEITAAAEIVVFRAMERCGNRLKNKLGSARPDGVAAADLYQYVTTTPSELDALLEDAWGPLERFGLGVYREPIERYTQSLLLTRKPHDRTVLASYLAAHRERV